MELFLLSCGLFSSLLLILFLLLSDQLIDLFLSLVYGGHLFGSRFGLLEILFEILYDLICLLFEFLVEIRFFDLLLEFFDQTVDLLLLLLFLLLFCFDLLNVFIRNKPARRKNQYREQCSYDVLPLESDLDAFRSYALDFCLRILPLKFCEYAVIVFQFDISFRSVSETRLVYPPGHVFKSRPPEKRQNGEGDHKSGTRAGDAHPEFYFYG